ncbi:porin family protein [Fibrobacter succinogenes]|uniref:porin family protein n=1 Tax=Fibrobacter succinogenes TaxID=833 RepID=UPI001565F83B|nr:porin family protein [Fibrobacter succinogenes]
MLKKILLAAFIAATASFAQIDFGARVGANVNTIRGDDSENFGSGIGFNAGAAVKISLPLLPITLAPEVLIDMRNFTYERNNKLSSTTWALDIPVMVRFSLLPILFIEGGPQFTFNLSTTSEEDLVVDTRLIKVNDGTIDDWYEFGTFEMNLAFGVGTGIVPFVDIDFRVVLGLSDFITEEKFTKTTDWDTANLQFMLGVTYWF